MAQLQQSRELEPGKEGTRGGQQEHRHVGDTQQLRGRRINVKRTF